MDFLHSIVAARVIFIFSILNIITGLAVFLSCRCLPGAKFASKLMRNQSYQRFYKLHCYFWLIFFVSVFIHAFFALNFLGVPF